MPWWGILLIGIGVGLLVALVVWLIVRSTRGDLFQQAVERAAGERQKALEQSLEAERESRAKVELEAKTLAGKLKELTVWYNGQRSKIESEARDEFEKLVDDPAALDAKLDALLGTSSSTADDDPTEPG